MLSVLITGASTGVGYNLASTLISAGFQVFGCVRNEFDAHRLQKEFGRMFVPLRLDVTDQASIDAAVQVVRGRLGDQRLYALINNAGVSMHGPLLYQPLDEFAAQMDVNVFGVVRMVKAFLPLLATERGRSGQPGRVLNIGSLGGELAVPLLSAYSASKFALTGLSDALRRELRLFGVHVVLMKLGAVQTEIFNKARALDTSRYNGTEYEHSLRAFDQMTQQGQRQALAPERVSKVILKVLVAKKPKPSYTIERPIWPVTILARWVPVKWADFLLIRMMGLSLSRSGVVGA